jgi:hypothetical protein
MRMRNVIARLEALSAEARQMGFHYLSNKLNDIIQDLVAIQDGLDMGPDLGK